MTDATHTPGPWLLDGDKICTNRDNEIARITRYGAWFDAGTPYGLKNPIGDANARLIAAAPDLLATLETAYRHFLQHMERDWFDDDDQDAMQKMFDAITKAKGN